MEHVLEPLTKLPTHQQEVVLLRLFEECLEEETASAMGCCCVGRGEQHEIARWPERQQRDKRTARRAVWWVRAAAARASGIIAGHSPLFARVEKQGALPW